MNMTKTNAGFILSTYENPQVFCTNDDTRENISHTGGARAESCASGDATVEPAVQHPSLPGKGSSRSVFRRNLRFHSQNEWPNICGHSHRLIPDSATCDDDVFLGESFAFYISIINVSTYTCKELSLKVDIQTQNQRIALGEMAFSGVSLSQNQQIGQIFTHEIQELGQHILVCTVSYQSMMGGPGPEAMNLRKFFKFPVTKLLDIVSQKFYELEDGSAVLEVQLRNLSPSPVFIERISVSNDLITPMSRIKQHEADQLSSKALRQYLFRLPRHDQQPSIIGPLEVRWRRSMGERGRIRCEVAQRMIPKRGDLHLTIEQNPKQVNLHQPFSVLFRLRNCSDRSLDLVLSLISELPPTNSSEEEEQQEPPLAPIIHCSVSGQRLQMILPNQTLEFSLDLLAIQPGLQYISGIRLTDTLTKKTYDFDDVTQVFVFH